jgi:hypothetical protein
VRNSPSKKPWDRLLRERRERERKEREEGKREQETTRIFSEGEAYVAKRLR